MKQIRIIFQAMLAAFLLFLSFPAAAVHAEGEGEETTEASSITILYTNDVHCAVDGYPILAQLREQYVDEGKEVLIVDDGDFSQGELIGGMTKGEAIIDIMNAVEYDVVTPGNHEFDYKMDGFFKNMADSTASWIGANFIEVATGDSVLAPYHMHTTADGHKVAFVGILTPETYTKSNPTYFKDEDGNWVYSFCEGTTEDRSPFYNAIQAAVDLAREDGAEAVVALGHTGMEGTLADWNTQTIIANTNGIDVYLDGHAHETVVGPDYNGTNFTNKDGKDVHYSSTGTKFSSIGELTITWDDTWLTFETELHVPSELAIDTEGESYQKVKAVVDEWKAKTDASTVIGSSEAHLYARNPDDPSAWLVRVQETNLGDFNADAYRAVASRYYGQQVDICFMNSGGIRADVLEGDVALQDLMNVNPWGNTTCVIEADGQTILDALEHGARLAPDKNGGFLQTSGLTYDVRIDLPNPVSTDDQGMFLGIDETMERRVCNVLVNGEPIDPAKTYTIVGTEYTLQQAGDGFSMLADNATPVFNNLPIDSSLLIEYFQDDLGGLITADQYGEKNGDGRIRLIEFVERVEPTTEADGYILYVDTVRGDEIREVLPKLEPEVTPEPVKPVTPGTGDTFGGSMLGGLAIASLSAACAAWYVLNQKEDEE